MYREVAQHGRGIFPGERAWWQTEGEFAGQIAGLPQSWKILDKTAVMESHGKVLECENFPKSHGKVMELLVLMAVAAFYSLILLVLRPGFIALLTCVADLATSSSCSHLQFLQADQGPAMPDLYCGLLCCW